MGGTCKQQFAYINGVLLEALLYMHPSRFIHSSLTIGRMRPEIGRGSGCWRCMWGIP